MAEDDITLIVGGRSWSKWRSAKATVRMGSVSGEFKFTLDDRSASGAPMLSFTPGAEAAVKIGDQTVLTGPIDRVLPSYDDRSTGVVIEGRDRTGQMIDCAAANKPGEWFDQTLKTIAQDLAKPFGIPVRIETSLGKAFKKFTISEGETAWAALRRACVHRGVLLMADGRGGLLLTKAGAGGRAAPIDSGRNVLRGEGAFDHSQRYSEYIIKGQNKGSGWGNVSDHATVQGRATDPAISLYRPFIDLAETSGDQDDLTRAAEVQAAIAAGRSQKVTHTLADWRQSPGGPVWWPNKTSYVRDTFLRVEKDLLIEQVSFEVDKDVERCTVVSVPASAWAMAALPEKVEDIGW